MASLSSRENLPPHVTASVMKELRKLAISPPDGVRYLPRDGDMREVHAEILGPEGTPFENGAWHVKLVLGAEFPAAPPKATFLTKIYHPNISRLGEVCVNTLKKDWKSTLGIAHVLKVIWCLLVVPFPESSLNDEAGKLFMENYGEFAAKAKLMTEIHAARRKSVDEDEAKDDLPSPVATEPTMTRELVSAPTDPISVTESDGVLLETKEKLNKAEAKKPLAIKKKGLKRL